MTEHSSRFGFWDDNVSLEGRIPARTQELLHNYSGLQVSEMETHIKRVAKKGWEIERYPCLRDFIFLRPDLSISPKYDTILRDIKDGALFLDLGCGLGQDIRQLVYDGAPPCNLTGLDLSSALLELGYDLFRDKGSLDATFLNQDFFEDTPALAAMRGKVRILNSGFFMHLWDLEGQVRVGERLVGLLAGKEGGIITGVHFASRQPGPWKFAAEVGRGKTFMHNAATLAEMWDEIGSLTGARFQLTVIEEEDAMWGVYDPDGFRLRWAVELQEVNNHSC